MAIPVRNSPPSQVVASARTFFVTSSIAEKRNLLQSDRSSSLFITILYYYRSQAKFRLHEFVVMPDHFHAIITVGSDLSIERAMQFIKGGFAFRAGRAFGFKAPVWQRGFSEVRILSEDAFDKVRSYLRNNPVARNLVLNPEDFPYSSAFPGYELDPPPQALKRTGSVSSCGIAQAMP
jgi:putative transposase